MADMKRWFVTYTKHLKQKRKVYQDGLLELQLSTNKLLLFDDCEKLLECRILKRDEVVSGGETLTFNAFLVDVNAVAEGSHEPSNFPEKSQRTGIEKHNSQKFSRSPSHKIIRDFKKREILKYEAIQHCKSPETAKTIVLEWEAMYTTQITQKAKKFHDGFVQLSARGSHSRQVMVLDSNRNNVVTKFLKKDENLESGGTILFEDYLVQIGEPLQDHDTSGENNLGVWTNESKAYSHSKDTRHKVLKHIKIEENVVKHSLQFSSNKAIRKVSDSIKFETEKNMEFHDGQHTVEPNTTEWQALYTTQLTQKSKKYHDGFLQLVFCGSRGRQAILYDENKTVLHSRFLRKDDVIRTGESLKLDAYLIQIRDLEDKYTANDSNGMANNFKVDSKIEKIPQLRQTFLASQSCELKGKSLTNAKVSTKESSERLLMNKPVRDASQILSFLQKPRIENSTAKCYTESEHIEDQPVSKDDDLDLVKDNHLPNLKSLVSPNKLSENTELDIPPDTKASKVQDLSTSGSKLPMDLHMESYSQKPFSEVETETQPVDVKSPSDDMDEYPSFDLGFEI